MDQWLLMEEFFVAVLLPRGLPEAEYDLVRQVLTGRQFRVELRRVVVDVIRRHLPSPPTVRITVTR